ncbi:MAG: acetate--CoA ligase family protein [Alphaproteobacteria bacterium]
MFRSPSPVLRARSIAIVGASERGNWASRIYKNLHDGGFPGKVYPVNPKRREVWGEQCFPDFAALPSPVELGLFIIPAKFVLAALADGVKHGIKAAAVYANNLGEGDDPEIMARGAALKALCEDTGLRVTGPNCMGSISLREKLFIYPNADLCKLPPGGVGAVFQSGGTMQFWVKSAADRGIKFSYAVSSGNELDLDLADYVNFFVDDQHTKQIVLFIEGIRRPDAFMVAARRAHGAGKPIIAIKTGRTPGSRQASKSHTGAIAGDYASFEAMCERYAIINCRSLDDMVETTLAFQGGRIPKGRRIGMVTTSGGTVDLVYDYAEDQGIQLPEFSPHTLAKIASLVPIEARVCNPLDYGIPSDFEVASGVCEAVLKDPNIDMLAWAETLSPKKTVWQDPEPIKRLTALSAKPVIGFGRMNYRVPDGGLALQEDIGFPFLQGLEPTLRALDALGFYGERLGRAIPQLPAPGGAEGDLEGAALAAALDGHGMTAAKSAIVATADEAVAAAEGIGFPVALKIISPDISHKTEVDGVRLNLTCADGVAVAAASLAEALKRTAPGAGLSGFLVQEMASGVEVIIGARDDELYGPIILVGAGGILVELARDVAIRLLPVTADDARAMVAELNLAKLLKGYRGCKPADQDALIGAITGLGQFYLDHRPWLADLEINPLMVGEAGRGVRAVDVRLARRNQQ